MYTQYNAGFAIIIFMPLIVPQMIQAAVMLAQLLSPLLHLPSVLPPRILEPGRRGKAGFCMLVITV
jgi:hypothetical protein